MTDHEMSILLKETQEELKKRIAEILGQPDWKTLLNVLIRLQNYLSC